MTVYCKCGGLIFMGLCGSCGKGNQMLCYKDRAWCSQSHWCTRAKCYRFLSEDERIRADKLGLPLALADFSKECGKQVKNEDG